MLRIDASRMSMHWTRLSRSRIATPRREASDLGSSPAGDPAALTFESAAALMSFGPPSFVFSRQRYDEAACDVVTPGRSWPLPAIRRTAGGSVAEGRARRRAGRG